jgi:hypothetical protein
LRKQAHWGDYLEEISQEGRGSKTNGISSPVRPLDVPRKKVKKKLEKILASMLKLRKV